MSRSSASTGIFRRWFSVIVVGLCTLVVTVQPPYSNGPDIRSDGVGYHAWTAAILRGDLDFCGDADLVVTGAVPEAPNAAGHCPDKYPPGLALLELPIMGPLSVINGRSFEPSRAEHLASRWLGAAALIAMCALVLLSCRRLDVPDWATHVAVLAIVFGTGLFHYGTYDNSFTHVYSATLFAALVFLGVRSDADGGRVSPGVIGAVSFLLVMIRETNLLLLSLLVGFWLLHRQRRRDPSRVGRAPGWQSLYKDQAARATVVGAFIAVAIEAAYATYSRGSLSLAAYGEEKLDVTQLHQLSVLFSYDRGLFTWYPIVALALGLILLTPTTRAAGVWWAAAIACLTFVYGSWHVSQLRGGFGHRGFIEIMPAGAVLFAIALGTLSLRRHVAVYAMALVGALSVLATTELLAGYWRGSMPFQDTTRDQYWSHVLGRDSVVAEVVRSEDRVRWS